jgi:predicted transcriptional regulator
MTIMPTAKQDVRDLLEKLPDQATFDDIEYQIYVLHGIREGIAEADRGELIDHEEVKRRMAKRLAE